MFGELVCGPPGSGKTTYCEGKRQFLSVYDPTRPVVVVNLDPANEGVFPYPCDVDVRELVQHSYVMSDAHLGPNGAYIFCMNVMEKNIQWIVQHVEEAVTRRVEEMLSLPVAGSCSARTTASSSHNRPVNGADRKCGAGGYEPPASLRAPYVIMDCPGQVEFYINSSFMHTLFRTFQKKLECSLCTVHLVDAVIATRDVPTYVSSCLLSLSTMIDHELPHLNILSKWDTLTTSPNAMLTGASDDMDGFQPFLSASNFLHENFDRMWHRHLRQRRHAQRQAQYHVTPSCPQPRLTREEAREDSALDLIDLKRDGGSMYTYSHALMSVVDGYGMVGFIPLDVQSQDMMLRVTRDIDNALGNFC